MIEETKAANSGADQPGCGESSVWTKSSPWKACLGFSTGPYMCTPQPVQAWRRMVAVLSTMESFWPFLVTVSLSWGTTATTEKSAPSGFQHLVQPQAWLWAVCARIVTSTGSLVHLQTRVPPWKSFVPGRIPPSTDG